MLLGFSRIFRKYNMPFHECNLRLNVPKIPPNAHLAWQNFIMQKVGVIPGIPISPAQPTISKDLRTGIKSSEVVPWG
jgi:hypothetical protein